MRVRCDALLARDFSKFIASPLALFCTEPDEGLDVNWGAVPFHTFPIVLQQKRYPFGEYLDI